MNTPFGTARRLIFASAATLTLFALLLLVASSTAAADPPPGNDVMKRTVVLEGANPEDAGGEARFTSHEPDLTQAQADAIQEQVESNVSQLQGRGILPRSFAPAHTLFAWPLKAVNGLHDPGYHGISNFVDDDPAFPNHLLDYTGGARTYDTSAGYNHSGTDIFLWPLSWDKMDAKQVAVLAAAAGTVTAKKDGNFDRDCSFNSPDTPNYVILTHADGSHSWYLHLKRGSVTTKVIGSSVSVGQVLGYVGSSGISTGPHLHFEVRSKTNKLVDPWLGPSNPTTTSSWWQTQKPYYDPAINKLTTGFGAPVLPNCTNETSNEQRVFTPGDLVYFTSYYRDQQANQQSQYQILRPNATAFSSWSNSSSSYFSASYWYWSYTIPANELLGTWTFRVAFNGKTYDQKFQVCDTKPVALVLKTPQDGGLARPKSSLKWSAGCADTFDVIVHGGTKTGPIVARLNHTYDTSLKLPALISGKKYVWRVTARNKLGTVTSPWQSFTMAP